ncbi:EAL domain-containing protein [Rhizobium sp. NPDC090279]|uniref:EAL domain-containing protein n=1 Tax=Rhizobium sp. NPDC090279 TaxID=3364499 RepID=UPI003839F9F1
MKQDIAQTETSTRSGLNCLGLVIDYLPQMAEVYGDYVADRVLHAVCRRAESFLPDTFASVTIEPWGVLIQAWGWDADINLAKALPALMLACERQIIIGEITISLTLSIAEFNNLPEPATGKGAALRIWSDQYHADMKIADAVYDAIDNGRLELFEQPVANVRDHAEKLYCECLARVSDQDGRLITPGLFLPALERLNITSAIDRYVVNATIEKLRMRKSGRLGCNVSVLSAVDDVWWASIYEDLRREPTIASRLVIEITESAPPENWSRTKGFITAMQRLGCRIALDDFGAGFSSIDFARSSGADIIKIDGSFVREAVEDERQSALLQHIVLLAGDCAAQVVIEGIETAQMCKIAESTGAGWLQGYLIGRPERTWPKHSLDSGEEETQVEERRILD